jgi:Domain of unknown function (DU1801)
MNKEIQNYNQQLEEVDLCNKLATLIDKHLKNATCKIWHAHPVWFIDDNPIVGYSKQKKGIRLMFWSGADFEEISLDVRGKKFKDASIFYNSVKDLNTLDIKRWLDKSAQIQWDYKNLIKRKGKLEKIKSI